MSADEPWREGEEVPLRSGGGEDFIGVEAKLVEDDGQFVHEAMLRSRCVFSITWRLRRPRCWPPCGAGGDDFSIQFIDRLQRLRAWSRL